jgi:hypothetical protein
MNLQVDVQDTPTRSITANDSVPGHARLLGFALMPGICVAGFWNARVVSRGVVCGIDALVQA